MIPKVSVTETFQEPVEVTIIEPDQVDGNITLEELNVISKLVKINTPKNVFEIGTFDGRTTINLAVNTNETAKILTLDLPKELLGKTKFPLHLKDENHFNDETYINKDETGTRYKDKKGSEKIIQLFGDSGTFDFSPYLNNMDFVFIDGSHSRDYVMNDTEVAFKLLTDSKGVIVWHDYGVWKDVTEVLNNYYLNDSRFKNCRSIEGTCLVYLKNS